MTVRNLYNDLYIIALVSKKQLAKVLVNFGINEVFASATFFSKLLVKSIYITGISKFFTQLLDEDFKETLVEKTIPADIVNLPFSEALYKLRNETNDLLVTVKRDGKIITHKNNCAYVFIFFRSFSISSTASSKAGVLYTALTANK